MTPTVGERKGNEQANRQQDQNGADLAGPTEPGIEQPTDEAGHARADVVAEEVQRGGLGATPGGPDVDPAAGHRVRAEESEHHGSGWVNIWATRRRAQSSALYLFGYHIGSSVAGFVGGLSSAGFGWPGEVGTVLVLLAVGLLVALSLPNGRRHAPFAVPA